MILFETSTSVNCFDDCVCCCKSLFLLLENKLIGNNLIGDKSLIKVKLFFLLFW